MKPILILMYFVVALSFCQAQNLNNTLYYGISSADSLCRGHQLVFKNDSTLEISTFPRHRSVQFTMIFKYKRLGKIIEVFNDSISKEDSIAVITNNFGLFLSKLVLIIDGKALVDDTNNLLVYVIHKDFKEKYYLTYLIDNKIYKQETGLSDAYGLIKNEPKENQALKKKLETIRDKLKDYEMKVYKGLEAYKKFGYECVFGVIELKQK